MSAKQAGPISWNLSQDNGEIEQQPEFEKKYGPCLKKLSKHVGEAVNSADIEAYQFLVHYVELIMRSGFELLKEVINDEKSKTFQDFLRKINISKN